MEAELSKCQTEIALLKSKNKIGEKEREILDQDLGNVKHVLGDVLERLKVLESGENATSTKKLVEAEMKLELARMERDMVERRLRASYGWNKRFYMEMVRIGTVPKPPSNDEGTERSRKKSKKSSFDGTKGPSEPRGPPGGFDIIIGMDWLSRYDATILCGEKNYKLGVVDAQQDPKVVTGWILAMMLNWPTEKYFDIIIGMDWLSRYDAAILCGEKKVRIPLEGKMLVIDGDKNNSRLMIVSCIKAQKYIEKGCELFLAQVTKQESKEKRLEDVTVIRDFLEVFPDELPRLLPPWQVEFCIDLIPGVAPVARAPYRLAPSEMKELSKQLQELSEKEEHGKHLKTILNLLRSEKLYAKFSKCDFLLDSVQFLGRVIDSSGVHVDLVKSKPLKLALHRIHQRNVRQNFRSDYDYVHYHPGKANVVADALSRKDNEPI
ncbi:hypothetical protein Tco_0373184 [Tanacetum coccineum]